MPIDVSLTRYKLTAILQDGSQVPLTKPALIGLQWEEQYTELAQRITAKLQDMQLPGGRWVHDTMALGTHLILTADVGTGYQQIMDAIVFTWDYSDSGNPTVTLTAYDTLYYLQASEDEILLIQQTPVAAILHTIFTTWNIPVVQFDLPDSTIMPTLTLRGRLGDMITQCLTQAFFDLDQEYILRAEASGAGVSITMPGSNTPIYELRGVMNTGSFQDSQTITHLVTEVKIVASQRPMVSGDAAPSPDDVAVNVHPLESPVAAYYPPPEQNTALRAFGRLRRVVRASTTQSQADLEKYAQSIIDEFGAPERTQRFTAPDIPALRRGDAIAVYAGTLNGVYLIGGVTHDADTRQMTVMIDSRGTYRHQLKKPNPGVKIILAGDNLDPSDFAEYRNQSGVPEDQGSDASGAGIDYSAP